METFTTAQQIGFISDCDILYSLDRSDPPGYYMLARKNKVLGTVVVHSISDLIVQLLKDNLGNAEEIRAVILQGMINSEWRLADTRSRG